MVNNYGKKYFEWGEWPELLLYKCFWLNTDAQIHKIVGVNLKEIIDIKGHYLWEDDVFEQGKAVFKENFLNEGWLNNVTALAHELTEEMLSLENSPDLKRIFFQASECLSCSEMINLFDHAFMEYISLYSDEEKQKILSSIHPKSQTHIMQLQSDIRSGKTNEYIINKYSWVGTHGFEGDSLTEEKIDNFSTKKAFEPAKYDSPLVEVGSQLAFYRSYIVETVDKILYSIIPNLKSFAVEKGISIDDVYYLTPSEILSFTALPVDIEERKKAYGVRGSMEGFQVWTGEVLEVKCEELIFSPDQKNSEVKGTVAFKGKVIGRAKVIVDKGELSNVEEGDIIISNETTPEYVLAMKKAGAIVTNLGGITSHAAIVAREMRKPCVTGTKIATKVFKNGDLVEVDADNGVVRIIK